MKRTADRLFGDEYRWSVLGAGRNQMTVAKMSAEMGGNVRVGLEDNLMLERGVHATNAQLVERAVQILRAMNVRILTAAEVRAKLGLTRGG